MRWYIRFARKGATTATFEIYNMSRFCKPPKLIGGCTIPLDTLSFVSEISGKCLLKNNGDNVGQLEIQVHYKPDGGAHYSSISSISFNNNMNDGSSGVDNSLQQALRPAFGGMQPISISDGRQMALPYFEEGSNLQEILENFTDNMRKRVEELKKADEPIDPTLPEDQRCVVCLEKKKAGVFYKCCHNCCCSGCGVSFIGSRCPICREFVFDFIKVYDT